MTAEQQNGLLCAVWLTVLILLAILLAGCARMPPPAERIVTRDVPVPYDQPCPAETDIPTVPKSVHEEHPTMPEAKDKAAIDQLLGAAAARERILAGKLLELETYAERADAILHACAAPHPPPG
ncbi:MAG TPA: hypothetical protein VH331_16745 [Allosphingosinicella sp.]|jgi:PBP1b-binding outer membrane lipoprotein LpoB|nr:hypothetical protein [Allosphingosinicella sp.]